MNAATFTPALAGADANLRAADRMPAAIWIALGGLACLPIGLLWDISHHSSIGRDTFWTPAHIIIQLGGIVPALTFAWVAFMTTFRGTPQSRAASVSFWGARAPVGAWVTLWGAVAMVSSAPFDDWWHNAYGLDVKIISPPHTILGLGMLGVGMGVLLFLFSSQNRASQETVNRTGLICALAVGVMLALSADFKTEFSWPNLQRTSLFYQVSCATYPFFLVMGARAARVRGAATIAALAYMVIYVAMILLLPLFPAQPRLAPIYNPVDHMMPPAFPLLMVLPAIAVDLLMALGARFAPTQATPIAAQPGLLARVFPRGWWRDWLLAVLLGAAFLGIFFAVQWHFSAFLLSDGAENRFFARSGHWPYFSQPGEWMNRFWDLEKDPVTMRAMLLNGVRAIVSARIGLLVGRYLLALKR